jgi:hypothetical protein
MENTQTVLTNKKYIVWFSNREGVFVWADEVKETNDTVSFLKKGKIEKSYKRTEIREYNEVTDFRF